MEDEMIASQSKPTNIEDFIGDLDFDFEELKRRYDIERDRRINRGSAPLYVPAKDGKFANFGKDPWAPPLTRPALHDHVQVIIAGGGFGGLLAGARLREAGYTGIRIIDEGGDFGGTWYWNRYPGLMCDVEAHIYLPLLEETNYAPRHRYAYGPEIFEHCQRIGRQYGLYDKACFQTSIQAMRWQEDTQRWLVETDRGDRMTADFVVLACGRQSLPKLPSISGIDVFAGHAFHSSRWDYNYTKGDHSGGLTGLSGKRVAVVGTAATAVQIVPAVAKWAKELYVFQRTPSTVGQRDNCETGPDWTDMTKPGWQRARQYNWQCMLEGLLTPEDDMVRDGWTAYFGRLVRIPEAEASAALGRPLTKEERKMLAEVIDFRLMNEIRARVDTIVKDPETAATLQPYYRWLCKRPCFHDDFLASFNLPNVHLVDTSGCGIERFTPTAMVVRDKAYDVDCVIFATGFEAGIGYTRLTGFELWGRGGITLSEHWAQGVRTVHGLMTDRFPNCFFVGGNQHSAQANNAVHLLDEQAEHVSYILGELKKREIATIEPSVAAVDDYSEIIRTNPGSEDLLKFFASCTPGYFNAEGKATRSSELFGGLRYGAGPMAFFKMLKDWRESGRLEGMVLRNAKWVTP